MFEPNSSLKVFIQVIERHKGKMSLLFVAVVLGTCLVTLLMPRSYLSQAKLLVRLGRENVTIDPTATFGQAPVMAIPANREGDINSVIESIKSQQLLEKVVDAEGPYAILGQTAGGSELPATPAVRHAALRKLTQNLNVEAVKRSNIIAISYEGPSPELAQAVVSKLVDFYLDRHIALHRTAGAEKFLADQAKRLHKQLEAMEKKLGELKSQTGLVAPESQRQVLILRIGKLEEDLLQTATTLAATEAEVGRLRDTLKTLPPTQVISQTKGMADAVTDGLRLRIHDLRLKELEYLTKFPEEHPEILSHRKLIEQAEALLAKQPAARPQTIEGPNRVHEDVQAALLKQESILHGLRGRAAILGRQLAEERLALKAMIENSARIHQSQREVDLHEALYRKYAENQEQAEIDQALKLERITNLGIVQSATSDIKPYRPRVTLNLALGLILALASSLALGWIAEHWPWKGARNLDSSAARAAHPEPGVNGRTADVHSHRIVASET